MIFQFLLLYSRSRLKASRAGEEDDFQFLLLYSCTDMYASVYASMLKLAVILSILIIVFTPLTMLYPCLRMRRLSILIIVFREGVTCGKSLWLLEGQAFNSYYCIHRCILGNLTGVAYLHLSILIIVFYVPFGTLSTVFSTFQFLLLYSRDS